MFYISHVEQVQLWVIFNLNARGLPAEVNGVRRTSPIQRDYVNINMGSSPS